MKKKILFIFFILFAAAQLAQVNSSKTDPTSTKITPIDIIAKIELSPALITPLCFWQNKIYATEKSGLLACYDTTGKILWKDNAIGNIATNAVIADSELAVGTATGDVITFNALNGQQIQSIGIDDSITTNLCAIHYEGDRGLILPKQTNSNSAIVFGTASGTLYCLDLETLQEYWRSNDSQKKIKSTPLIIENKILYTSSDGFIYCLDARTGLLIWRWKEVAETDFSESLILLDGKRVLAVAKDNQLYCIDFLLGKLIWKAEKIKAIPAIGFTNEKKNLFVKSLDNKIFILSCDKGKVIKEIKQDNSLDVLPVPPIERNGKIFFIDKGSLFTLDEKYNEELLLTFGKMPINSITQVDENKFTASNSNGTIIIFRIR